VIRDHAFVYHHEKPTRMVNLNSSAPSFNCDVKPQVWNKFISGSLLKKQTDNKTIINQKTIQNNKQNSNKLITVADVHECDNKPKEYVSVYLDPNSVVNKD